MSMCPYYHTDYKTCNLTGNNKDGYPSKDEYCLSSDRWRQCDSYYNQSMDDKVSKRLRPNPDL